MAVINSFAKFFGAVYPPENVVLDTADPYGDTPNNILNGSYDAAGGGTIPLASDVRFGTDVGATTGTAYIPVATDVRFGTNVDATTGTVVIPQPSSVVLGLIYDVAPQEKTGNVRVPAAGDVRLATAYGSLDTDTGTLDVDAEDNHPTESQVADSVQFGSANQYTGNVVSPIVDNVRLGIGYGANGVAIGTLNVDAEDNHPQEDQVLTTIVYGNTNQYLGNLDPAAGGTVPLPANVRFGVAVGEGDTGTAYIPTPNNVRLTVPVDATTGTLNIDAEDNHPTELQVEEQVVYGDQLQYTGQLVPGAADGDPFWGACSRPEEIALVRGDAYTDNDTDWGPLVFESEKTLVGETINWTLRDSYSQLLIDQDTDGVTVTGVGTTAVVSLTSAATADLPIASNLKYDVEVAWAADDNWTFVAGPATVQEDQTRD